jgi:hypothetical protein
MVVLGLILVPVVVPDKNAGSVGTTKPSKILAKRPFYALQGPQ